MAEPAAQPATPREAAAQGGKTVLLHVGTQKTGSSSIQHFLRQHEDEARDIGVNFVRTGRDWIDHNHLARELRSGEETVPLMDSILAEMRDSPEPLQIISAEEMFHPRAALRLAEFLPEELRARTWIIAYLRRPDELMESLYKQRLKTGVVEPGPMRYLNQSSYEYDYLGALDAYKRGFGRERMVIRPYRRDLLEGGDGVRDFLRAVGIEELAALPREKPEDNPSFSVALSELMGVYANAGGDFVELNEMLARQSKPGIKRSGDVFQVDQRRRLLESLQVDFDRICAEYGEHLRPVLSMPDFDAESEQRRYPGWREWNDLHQNAGRAMTHALMEMASRR